MNYLLNPAGTIEELVKVAKECKHNKAQAGFSHSTMLIFFPFQLLQQLSVYICRLIVYNLWVCMSSRSCRWSYFRMGENSLTHFYRVVSGRDMAEVQGIGSRRSSHGSARILHRRQPVTRPTSQRASRGQ